MSAARGVRAQISVSELERVIVLIGRSPRLYAPKGGELPIAIDMDKTGITNTQQSLHFLDCLCDHAARLAGRKLVLQLNEHLIGAIYPTCKDRRNVKGSDRILREKGRRIGNEKLRGFQGPNVCSVRLVQQDGEFAEHGARLRHPGDFNIFLDDYYCALSEDQQAAGPRTSGEHGLAGLVGRNRKASEPFLKNSTIGI